MHIKWENPTLNKQLKHADLTLSFSCYSLCSNGLFNLFVYLLLLFFITRKFSQNSNIVRAARLEKLNSPYFWLFLGLSKSKNGMCFLSSNISVFPRKTTFSISGLCTNLASPNRAENQTLSFDSRVAFIQCRKVVIQLTFCRTIRSPKKHNCRKIGLI